MSTFLSRPLQTALGAAALMAVCASAHAADVFVTVTVQNLAADDYVAKPFSMLELVARIRALLRRIEQMRSANATKQEFRFGPFRLDAVRRELMRGDVLLPLTLREFNLLYFLLKHPGRPFSRGELLQRV